jgi:hypothetical protein
MCVNERAEPATPASVVRDVADVTATYISG